MLNKLEIKHYTTLNGKKHDIQLSYEIFGQPLHSAPTILVNHALTGNSNVAGDNGWWLDIIGKDKCIDTNAYTILAFNIPGNGYDDFLITNYKDFVAADIAQIFLKGLDALKITRLFAIIGGSLGGGIAWEMAVINPNIAEHLIPVASDWKATDWLIANCQIQEQILNNSNQPVHDARMHAMLCYRTPESFKERFRRGTNKESRVFEVESWLMHHGKKLQQRFQLSAYKLMNQLLKTIDVTRNEKQRFETLQKSNTKIHIIGVDSDLFFTAKENKETFRLLVKTNKNVVYREITSLHGHDAFLMEFNQLEALLRPIFNPKATAKPLWQGIGAIKKVNLAVFGHGNVGYELINQIITSHKKIYKRRGFDINIFAVANSKKLYLYKNGISKDWKNKHCQFRENYQLADVISFANQHQLENLIALDNTASTDFVKGYVQLVEAGFNLVSSNKIANTLGMNFYQELRLQLERFGKHYLYETNVGAGLPLIDTIKLLHLSGENITKIKGVFSGSLSYIFNIFSETDVPFSQVILKAVESNFTEPDPREDLSGNDVGRKLLILARELDLHNEFSEIAIENLISEELCVISKKDFLIKLDSLDSIYEKIKNNQKPNHVLRYVGELHGDLQKEKGILDAKLVSVPKNSSLGQVSESDSIIEIYTESYGENPIVIQGAGAGATVTARGVFGDILRIAEKL